jgi:[protein-PII] uridylyltransferase
MKKIPVGIRESVLAARSRWNEGRNAIREQHDQGASGTVVVRQMSNLLDEVLIDLYQAAIKDISPELETRIAVVLHGGNGRHEVAPFSDIDLMVLYQGSFTEDIAEFARRISQDIIDTGVQLGFSLRTVRDACGMSLKDPEMFTSLTASRCLRGNQQLFDNFYSRFKRIATRQTAKVIRGIVAARDKERQKYGATVYMLRPNVKKSRGGLRDIHLIRWLGFVRCGTTDIDRICERTQLTSADQRQLTESSEFLLRLRNELHFHAGSAQDGLGRNEQVRIAEKFEYEGNDAVLPVESFMRDYFRYTSRVRYICDHFTAICDDHKTLSSHLISPLVTRQIDHHFRMGPTSIGIVKSALHEVKSDLQEVLRLLQLCSLHGKSIDHETWLAIRQEMLESPDIQVTRQSAQRFMALLSNTTGLSDLLYKLHEMQVLQKIIPAFKHARGLLQFNEYHVFTVDEHSLQAIWQATELENQNSVVGKTYRSLRRKNILHLALLLHDLGKGFAEDHSEVGRRIAEETGRRFGLSADETEDIMFLVHNHLVMSHLAFHRDINDESMVAEFASNVGSVELLSMLFVLTCADIAAVGPGVMNDWKLGLLTSLYSHAKKILTGNMDDDGMLRRYHGIYELIASHGRDPEAQQWLRESAANLPNNYCDVHDPEAIAHQLLVLRDTAPEEVQCWVNRIEGTRLIELCIGKREKRRSGIFFKISGMMASLGLMILSADIKPLGHGLVWYWFQFQDGDFSDPPQSRLDDIRFRARDLLLDAESGPPTFRSEWRKKESRALQLSRPKIQVKVNNQTVDTATIIDVFAYNKTGLLYRIGKKIYQLGLDVSYARISTYAHQVIDVFYVTDDQGNKIRNKNQIQIIKKEILKTVKDFLEPPKDSEDKL